MPKKLVVDPLSLDFGRDKRFCVYIYRDPRPRKRREPIYVGKGLTERRPDEHWNNSNSPNPFFSRVLEKIRTAGLQPIIEFIAFFENETEAFALEIALIKKFGRRDLGRGTLCNMTDGGDGVTGPRSRPPRWTEEHREERSRFLTALNKSRAGIPHTPEHNAKISAGGRGIPKSESWKAKQSVNQRGVPETEETKAKMRKPKSPEGRAGIAASNRTPRMREIRHKDAATRWADPAFRERTVEAIQAGIVEREKRRGVTFKTHSKLTEADVAEIKRLLAIDIQGATIARAYSVCKSTISQIKRGRTHK